MISYVEVRDTNREIIGILDDFSSIIWQVDYYDNGSFEIYTTATPENLKVLKKNNYITRGDDDNVGIIENIEIKLNEQDGLMIAASGSFGKSVLGRRIVYKLAGSSAGKVSILPTVSSGNVENAVRKLVDSHIINSVYPARNVDFIRLGEVKGIDKKIVSENGLESKKQTSFGNLLEYTNEILQEYEMSSYMAFDRENKEFVFNIFEGKDRSRDNTEGNDPVIFSQEYDNLLSSNYATTLSTANTALIGGEGEGVDRFCAMIGENAVGLDRKEIWVDASSQSLTYQDENGEEKTYTDDEYVDLLQSSGKQTIATFAATESYEGEINVNNPQYKYKRDYNIGDLVSVEDRGIGVYLTARILSVIESQDENGYLITVSYGI